MSRGDRAVWEAMWSPYDESTYRQVLSHVGPEDVVVDIGAGDLRLDRRLARISARVFAYEQRADIVALGLRQGPLPRNVVVVVGDARLLPFPRWATVGILLMRHCQDVALYASKLKVAGARRLITNARWGLDVEVVDLRAPRVPYEQVKMGWYACWCGETGFVPGPPEALTPMLATHVHEVVDCPACREGVSDVLSPPRPASWEASPSIPAFSGRMGGNRPTGR